MVGVAELEESELWSIVPEGADAVDVPDATTLIVTPQVFCCPFAPLTVTYSVANLGAVIEAVEMTPLPFVGIEAFVLLRSLKNAETALVLVHDIVKEPPRVTVDALLVMEHVGAAEVVVG